MNFVRTYSLSFKMNSIYQRAIYKQIHGILKALVHIWRSYQNLGHMGWVAVSIALLCPCIWCLGASSALVLPGMWSSRSLASRQHPQCVLLFQKVLISRLCPPGNCRPKQIQLNPTLRSIPLQL